MHLVADFNSQGTVAVYFLQSVDLDTLELVEVDVVAGTFHCFLLGELCILEVVVLYCLSFLPGQVVEIFDSMSILALILLVEAQSSEIEPAE